MSDGRKAREETRGHLDVISTDTTGERSFPQACVSWRSRVPASAIVGVALGAAAVGGLGVWLYLRAGANPQNRASHRIDELRHRLTELADQLARHTQGEELPGAEAGAA